MLGLGGLEVLNTILTLPQQTCLRLPGPAPSHSRSPPAGRQRVASSDEVPLRPRAPDEPGRGQRCAAPPLPPASHNLPASLSHRPRRGTIGRAAAPPVTSSPGPVRLACCTSDLLARTLPRCDYSQLACAQSGACLAGWPLLGPSVTSGGPADTLPLPCRSHLGHPRHHPPHHHHPHHHAAHHHHPRLVAPHHNHRARPHHRALLHHRARPHHRAQRHHRARRQQGCASAWSPPTCPWLGPLLAPVQCRMPSTHRHLPGPRSWPTLRPALLVAASCCVAQHRAGQVLSPSPHTQPPPPPLQVTPS